MSRPIYVSELSNTDREEIRAALQKFFDERIDEAMRSKVVDLEDTIDISKYPKFIADAPKPVSRDRKAELYDLLLDELYKNACDGELGTFVYALLDIGFTIEEVRAETDAAIWEHTNPLTHQDIENEITTALTGLFTYEEAKRKTKEIVPWC